MEVGSTLTVVVTNLANGDPLTSSTTYKLEIQGYNDDQNVWDRCGGAHRGEKYTGTFTTAAAPTALSVNPTVYNLLVGEQAQIGYTVTPEQLPDGFISANTSIATVDALGKITAVAVGTTTITVTAGEHTKTVTVNVQLNQPEFTNIVPAMTSADLEWDKNGAGYVEKGFGFASSATCTILDDARENAVVECKPDKNGLYHLTKSEPGSAAFMLILKK